MLEFYHESENFYTACGILDEEVDRLTEIFNNPEVLKEIYQVNPDLAFRFTALFCYLMFRVFTEEILFPYEVFVYSPGPKSKTVEHFELVLREMLEEQEGADSGEALAVFAANCQGCLEHLVRAASLMSSLLGGESGLREERKDN